MTPKLLDYLCEPITKEKLQIIDIVTDAAGDIDSGTLVAPSGARYPIINGIPRFVDSTLTASVKSFGDEWNYFNFTYFKSNWLKHTVANTFGGTDFFKGKLIVDAGGGSGAQTRWFSEYGASHVIMMDLSHSVDDVVKRNLEGVKNVDIIQCSIDAPPLQDECIDGIVYCHNVIQHTPSVEKTAQALFALTASGGQFVFNCYSLNDKGAVRWIRFHLIYEPLRSVLRRMPFFVVMLYARLMGFLRLIPGFGFLLEKSGFCVMGDVPREQQESAFSYVVRRFKTTCLNTFDGFGSHTFQHHKSELEIRGLVNSLQSDEAKVINMDEYFLRPPPIGCALRIYR